MKRYLSIYGGFTFLLWMQNLPLHAETMRIKPETPLADETRAHLLEAMKGEAFAYLKYILYAEQARSQGKENLAKVFEKAAHVERFEHFREMATLAGLVQNEMKNVRESINGEVDEALHFYPHMAEAAEKAGDTKAAELFREISGDEGRHAQMFKAELQGLEALK